MQQKSKSPESVGGSLGNTHLFFPERECIEFNSHFGCNFWYLPQKKEKKCHYTASSRDELEKTPPSDFEICLSRDFAPIDPRAFGCKIPTLANLSILEGAYFPIHPSFWQCIIRAFIFSLSVLQHISSTYNAVTVAPTKDVVTFGTVATSGAGLNNSLKTAGWSDGPG